jgi:peptidoglycan/xylan/chitin deacetylase (PgdA/CDA1 family)
VVDFNSSKARKCAGRSLDSFENLAIWNMAGGTLSASTDTYFSGSQSAQIEARPNSRATLSRQFDGGIDLSARDLSIATKLERPKTGRITVRLLAPNQANSMVLSRYFGAADWLRLDLGPSEIRGRPDLTNVRELRIEVSSSAAKLRLFVDSIRTTPRPAKGSVMLTFDDNVVSQYETAFPIMQRYGFSGVVGVIDSMVGSDSRIPLDGMREMQAAGWDMVSHPHSSRSEDFPELPSAKRRAELRANKQWLIDHGFERGARFLIWPFNAYDASSLEIASRYHYLCFTLSNTPIGHRPTGPLVAGRVKGDYVDLTKRMIDFAARYNQLVVLMYHAIGAGDWVDEAGFESTMKHIDRTDIDVITASDLWRMRES